MLTAALKRLSAIKCKVVCTTHFLEIFSLDLVHDGIEGIKASRMTVHWPSEDEPNQAVPLFKLEDGVANSSAGLSCAQTAGVHRDVIGRAHEIISALKNGDKVEPSMDVIRPKLDNLSVDAKEALTLFLRHPNWKSASDSDVRRLLHHINRM